jgi:hypothetical protein
MSGVARIKATRDAFLYLMEPMWEKVKSTIGLAIGWALVALVLYAIVST